MNRRKTIFALIFLTLTSLQSFAKVERSERTDSMLAVLQHAIERRDLFYTTHAWKIDSVKKVLAKVPLQDNARRADLLHDIFVRYQSFQGDSAQATADHELKAATATGDPDAIMRARTDKLYSYVASGCFTDAVDIVRSTDHKGVSPHALGVFYFLCNRLYTDMSNYSDGTFSDTNARISKAYADSVIMTVPATTYESRYASIFKTFDDLYANQKIDIFAKLMERKDVPNSEKAMIASVLGDLYFNSDDRDNAIYYKALSGYLDISEAKRETSALRRLAEMMFQDGDYERASEYINVALDDANFFNAPHRKAEIANVLPLIDTQRFASVDSQRRKLWWALGGLFVLLLALAALFVFYIKAVRRLRESNRVIADRSIQLQKANEDLATANAREAETNARLSQTLANLRESVKIKDEYLGYGFYANSEAIKKKEELYKLVRRKVKARQVDDLLLSLRDSDLRKEKEKMLTDFDSIFLKLFPSFPDRYYALFPADSMTDMPDDKHSLTPEMRIFALIRLGITDISKIATFLNYSVNTVNTYKTRAKNRSTLENANFESAIMEIRSVS